MNPPEEGSLSAPPSQSVLKRVFLFYCCFLLLTTSGRLGSSDAGNQLRGAILLATTGHLGTQNPPNQTLWARNSAGEYYEVHDIGNIVLMLPAAFLGRFVSRNTAAEQFLNPPIFTKVATALTYTALCALASLSMFLLFIQFHEQRVSFLLSFAFVTTTIFWPYAKSAWDVLGACCCVTALLYFSASLINSKQVRKNVAGLAVSLALACSFRYSVGPFLFLSASIVLFFSRAHLQSRHWVLCAIVFFVGMIPTFLYNHTRMGSFLTPATVVPFGVATGTADLHGNVLVGLYGLFFSPNRGLFVFAPMLLLSFFLPFAWKSLPSAGKQLCLAFSVGALTYSLFIAKLRTWGSFGWGPRYLVPILPMLFYLSANIIAVFWKTCKLPISVLLLVSAALCLAPVLVNWPLAVANSPQPLNQLAAKPYQQIAVWDGLLMGMEGKSLPTPNGVLDDPLQSTGSQFPDLLIAHLMQSSRLGMVTGSLLLPLLLVSTSWLFWRMIQKPRHTDQVCS